VNVVRDIRVQAGLTQALLARLSGVSQSSIGRYETGSKSPTLDVLSRLAAAVDLAIEVNIVPHPGDNAPVTGAAPPADEAGPATHTPRGALWTI